MASLITDMAVNKPSKALNLVYLVFGYFLASFFTFPTEFSFEQKLAVALIAGGIISSFLYFTKPVETILKLILHFLKRDRIVVYKSAGHEVEIKRSQVISSPLLAEERAKINSLVFFFFSLALSSVLLNRFGITVQTELILGLSAAFMIIGIVALWEIYIFVKLKARMVAWYYLSYKLERDFREARNAIEKKDWREAEALINRDLWTKSIYASSGRICLTCKKMFLTGMYCPDCGKELLIDCKNCAAALIREGMTNIPKYCTQCGQATETNTPARSEQTNKKP